MDWMDDPKPDGELPSDADFAAFLDELNVEQTLLEYRTTFTGYERSWLEYLIRKARRRHG